jgi:hydroxyacylglutathione hydrolase
MGIPKIAQFNTLYVNPLLLVNGENSILIDTGRKGHGEKILQKVKGKGLQPTDIKLIILTHTHFDHTGNVAYLKEKTGAKVVVHKNEKNCLEKGFTKIPRGSLPTTKVLSWLGRYPFFFIGKYKSAKADIVVDEKLSLTPWGINGYVLHTPGHTSGSMSVIIEKTIFAGDVFFNRGLKGVFPPFADNPQLLLKTWEKIFNLGVEEVWCGHGPRFKIEKAKETFLVIKNKKS